LPGAGFLDEDLGSKPAYEVLGKLINEEWRTPDMQLTTDRNGTIQFRGFHGKYRLEATSPDGTAKRYEIHLTREGAGEWVLEAE
jgi:hypothetical protein